MGGQEAGGVASTVARKTVVAELDRATRPWTASVYEALRAAHRAVIAAGEQLGKPSMGSTAVCAVLENGRCWVGWIGDSRLYVFRGSEVLEQTEDHTRVGEMVEHGVLTPEQAKHHPDAHILTRVLGGGNPAEARPVVWNEPVDLQAGDLVLLCSDGLYDLLEANEIYDVVVGQNYAEAARRLIDAANARGGHDNISVALAVVGQPDVPMRRAPAGDAAAGVTPGFSWISNLTDSTATAAEGAQTAASSHALEKTGHAATERIAPPPRTGTPR